MGGAGGGGVAATGPTWAHDVAPLVSEHCSSCHAERGIAPFALETYAQARPMAAAIARDVESKKMPPWMPGGQTPALLHERTLTAAQIATFVAWSENGAPEGDPSRAAPLPPPEVVAFGSADVATDIGADYVPDTALADDYRCFLVELGVTEDRMAAAFQVTPGNRKVVHHVVTTLYAGSSKAALQALDAQSPGPGWQCFGGAVPTGSTADAVGSIGAWVPGVSAVRYPAGTGNRIPANAIAVMQIHYNLAGGHGPDRTRLTIELVPKTSGAALQPIVGLPLIRRNLEIPPSSMNVVQQNKFPATVWSSNRFPVDGDAWIIGVAGHMHLLGTRIELVRSDATGDHTLLDIPAWDFHWQGTYYLQQAVQLKATDAITIRCTYNNPGTAMVTWGEGTNDEMCFGTLQLVDKQPPSPL